MRKRSITALFDGGFWLLVAVLPLIAYVIMLWFNGLTGLTLASSISACGFSIAQDNVIYTAILSLFGSSGVFPLFSSPDILIYLSYFVIVELAHMAVDILLFIPRFAHKMIESFSGVCHE